MKIVVNLGPIAVWLTVVMLAGCASGRGRTAIANPGTPAPALAVQALYESGADRELVNRVKNGVPDSVTSGDRWFAALSQLRLGLRDDALAELSALSQSASDPAVRVA